MSLNNIRSYDSQIKILLAVERGIDNAQQYVSGETGYAAISKLEDRAQLEFAKLLQTKYPELQAVSASEIVMMINQLPQILDISNQISDLVGSYGTIGNLEDAKNAAYSAWSLARFDQDLAKSNFFRAQRILDDLKDQQSDLTAQLVIARSAFLDAEALYTEDPSDENLQALNDANANLNALLTQNENLGIQITAAEQEVVDTTAALATANSVVASTSALLNDLEGRFDEATRLDTILQSLTSSNVVYSLYAAFSTSEKELIELFTVD